MKSSKMGFTLIELLAVIVVLAVIALIAVPIMLNVIEKAKKGSLKDSAYGILESSELYLAKNLDKERTTTLEFTCSNEKCVSGTEEIVFNGEINIGRIKIYSDNKIELCIIGSKYAAIKTVNDKEVIVKEGTCNYDELSYGVAALVSQAALDAKQAEIDNLNNLIEQTDITANDIVINKKAVSQNGLITGTYNIQPLLDEAQTKYDELKEQVETNNIVALFSGTCTNSTSWATYNASYYDSLFITKVNSTYVIKTSGTYQFYSYGVASCWGCSGANTGGGRFLVNGVAKLTNSFTNSGVGTFNLVLNEGDIITWQQYGCIYNCVNTMGTIYRVQ